MKGLYAKQEGTQMVSLCAPSSVNHHQHYWWKKKRTCWFFALSPSHSMQNSCNLFGQKHGKLKAWYHHLKLKETRPVDARFTFLFWETKCIVPCAHSPNERARTNNALSRANSESLKPTRQLPWHVVCAVHVRQDCLLFLQNKLLTPNRWQARCRRRKDEAHRWSFMQNI